MAKTFQTISPIDGSTYVERSFTDDQMIDQTLEKAVSAQKVWKQTTISERAQACHKVVEYFTEHAAAIGEEITWQMGRPIRYTPFELTKGFKERAEYMIGIAEVALANIDSPEQDGFRRFIAKEPLGVVLVLAPWNYPYLTSVNAIIPAIMSGNTVILKHATQTPLCSERYAKAFAYAGVPEGVFQYLHMDHDQVGEVIKDKRIDFISFTGSVAGGVAVQKALSGRFIRAGLELGGKDPAYVRPDADIESAIENLVDGSFFNSGQSCCGLERIYVHQDVYSRFLDGFVNLTNQYKVGNPTFKDTTLGPVVRPQAAAFVIEQINGAVGKGAKQLIDTKAFKLEDHGSTYLSPRVLVDVDHSMNIMTEETFGPVVGIMLVKDDAEAVRLMNDSQYGLTASVWTQDADEALAIGKQIETGTFFMNRCDYLDPTLAWTGVKNSGHGCTLSPLGYESLTRPKSYHLKLN